MSNPTPCPSARLAPAILLGLGLVVGAPACTRAGSNNGPLVESASDSFDRNGMLDNLGRNTVLPAYESFVSESSALLTATTLYADALRNGAADVTQRRDDARAAWRSTMAVWQRCEIFQFGPAGSSLEVIGGEDRREQIYSYPTINRCRVDQEIVEGNFLASGYPAGELVNVFGLDALEQLLFDDSTENACPPQATINSDGSWDALVSGGTLAQRRADYAVVLARHLSLQARGLRDRWSPSADNFVRDFANAGLAGSPYPSAQGAVNDVYIGMFYVDSITKDLKLATPLGLSGPNGVDPSAVESPLSRRSKEHILANLRAFQELYLGNAPGDADRLGFDDFLAELGADALAMTVTMEIAAAIAAVEAIPGTLSDALTNNPSSVQSAHDAVRVVTTRLKAELPTILNLRVPQQGAGDND